MLTVAKGKLAAYPNVTFCRARASQIPFPKESFDLVVCSSSFHYFENPNTPLLEMKRVLKMCGRMIILDWSRDYLLCRFCDLFLKLFDATHKQCYTQRELRRFLEAVGFQTMVEKRFKANLIWGMMLAEAVK